MLLALLAFGSTVLGQVIEIDEVISREVGIHVGGISTPDVKEVVSREASLFIENGRVDGEVISREISVVVDKPGAPPQVTGYTVTPAADGSSVVLNWSNYNQWAVGDVDSFRIYLSNQPFSDVTGIEPFMTVRSESVMATLNGLATFQDHYIAIVAVDGLQNFNPVVLYSAAYILTKEIISREVSVAFNAEQVPQYREVVSREVSVVRDNPGAPAPITDFVVATSPIGDTATLDWNSYNQWAQYDVAFYRVYYSDTIINSLDGINFVDVPGETFTHTFDSLAPWVDHYFAIVPVDALGNSDPVFNYGAAYVISPEVISREVAVFMGQEPPAPPPIIESIPVENFSFESPDVGNFIYWGSMSGAQRSDFAWTGAGNGGSGPALFNNGGAWGFANVPDGSQGVSLQGDSSITREFSIATAGSYTLKWSAASRAGQVNPYVIQLNGTVVSPIYSTTNTAWQSNSATFEISTPGLHSITFAVVNAVGDNSVGIDAISLSRFEADGNRPFSSLREIVSREVSVVRPDATTPAPVTFAGSSFSATTARTTYNGIALNWGSYNEWAQFDVYRYRIYTSSAFVTNVSEMNFHSFAPGDGTQVATIVVPNSETIYYVAVVAEDVQGNFNSAVYPVSVKMAVGELGPVANLTAAPTPTTITFSWDLGGVGDELADFVKEFWVYFDGESMPIVLGPSSRSWTASSLNPETTYSVVVKTVDMQGVPSDGVSVSATTLEIPPGTVEPVFNPDVNGNVFTTTLQADGKILIGGDFTMIGGVSRNRIARLNADYTLDAGFNPDVNGTVNCIAIQADGKILIGGGFTNVGGTSRVRLARLHKNGVLDGSFSASANSSVYGMAIQPDGDILVCGAFTSIGESGRNGVARLDVSGSLDTDFNPNANGSVTSVSLQPDGKIVIGGLFSTIGGVARSCIARINADGTLDTTFDPNANNYVYAAMVEPDGQIVLGGEFTQVGNIDRNRIARINADGTLDNSFDPDANAYVQTLSVQVDGSIIVGGNFTTIGGATRHRVARLTADGAVDVRFNPNPDAVVYSTNSLADGRILIAGNFANLDGIARNRLALVTNDPATQSLSVAGTHRILWLRGGASPEAQSVTFGLSTEEGGSVTELGSATRTVDGWELTGLSLPNSGRLRARARVGGCIYGGSSSVLESSVDFVGIFTPFQQWKQTNLGDAHAEDLGDPDFDGLPTLVEYALGTWPNIPNDTPLTGTLFNYPEGGRLRIFVPRDPEKNDITVEVLAASSLTGPWATIATSEAGAPFTGAGYVTGDSATPGLKSVEIRDIVNIADSPARFLRVRAILSSATEP